MIRVTLLATLLLACGPSVGGSDESDTDAQTDTGEPVCMPWDGAALAWERQAGADGLPREGKGVHVAVDDEGGVIAVTTDATDNDDDVLVSRLDPNGALSWSLRYEGAAGLRDTALDVAVDRDGSIYVLLQEQTFAAIAGGFDDRAEFQLVVLAIASDGTKRWRWSDDREPPDAEYPFARTGAIAIIDDHIAIFDVDEVGQKAPPSMLELDAAGNTIARTDLAADVSEAIWADIAIAGDGAMWAIASPYRDSWIARIDRDGAIAWQTVDTTEDVRATAIVAGATEAYVLSTTGDPELGDVGIELRRIESDGAVGWTFAMPWPTGNGFASALVRDCDGDLLIAGEIEATLMGTPPARTRTPWIGAITEDGALAWSVTLDDDRAIAPRSMALGSDGTLVLGGLQGSEQPAPWLARLTSQ